MSRTDLSRLSQLATMKRDIDLQHVSHIAVRMNAIQAEIDRLRGQSMDRAREVELDPARLTGVDVVWQRWVNATITRHQTRMAELALAREAYLARARVSFGRADVLSRLVQKGERPRRTE